MADNYEIDSAGYSLESLGPVLGPLWAKFLDLSDKLAADPPQITYESALDQVAELKAEDAKGWTWRIDPEISRFVAEDSNRVVRANADPTQDFSYKPEQLDEVLGYSEFDGYVEGGDYDAPGGVEVIDESETDFREQVSRSYGSDDDGEPTVAIPRNLEQFKHLKKGQKIRLGVIAAFIVLIFAGIFAGASSCGGSSTSSSPIPPPATNSVTTTTVNPNALPAGEGPDAVRVSAVIKVLAEGDYKKMRAVFGPKVTDGDVRAQGAVFYGFKVSRLLVVDGEANHGMSPTTLKIVTTKGEQVAITQVGWVKENGQWVISNNLTFGGQVDTSDDTPTSVSASSGTGG